MWLESAYAEEPWTGRGLEAEDAASPFAGRTASGQETVGSAGRTSGVPLGGWYRREDSTLTRSSRIDRNSRSPL